MNKTRRQPNALPEAPAAADEAPQWLARAIDWAREREATDLHFFPSEADARLWARIDGELREAARYSRAVHERLVARLKVLGRCADYNGDLVVEGRFALNGSAAQGEARLSVVPTLQGEKAVVRLLAGAGRLRRLDELGLCEALTGALRRAVDRPQGLLLAVGPSGCGKSTALYALLDDLRARAGGPLSIVTIEDPIEQSLACAAQIAANPARGLGFAAGLRALLRQDPEAIMIGEIRDAETAETALQAALTGHRLLSSMHTLTAAEALVRLRQMGAPAYVVSSAVAGVLNLRLAPTLCPDCLRRRPMSEDELAQTPEARDWPEPTVAEAPGCDACMGRGRRGRAGLGEWVTTTPETAEALEALAPTARIAATLSVDAPARATALELIRQGRVGLEALTDMAGLTLRRDAKEANA